MTQINLPSLFLRQSLLAPKSKVILGSMLLACGIAGCCSVALSSGGEIVPTMNTDWKNATKEYMKFQKMNPIFGESIRSDLLFLEATANQSFNEFEGISRDQGKE